MKLPLSVAAIGGLASVYLLHSPMGDKPPPRTDEHHTPTARSTPSTDRPSNRSSPPLTEHQRHMASPGPRQSSFAPVHQEMIRHLSEPPQRDRPLRTGTAPSLHSTGTPPEATTGALAQTAPSQTEDEEQPLGDLPPLPPAICFAPNTDPALREALWAASAQNYKAATGLDPFKVKAFQLGNRWSRTAVNGFSSNSQGEPVTLTWGFLPDGVVIPGGNQGSGEPSSGSDLIAWLNSNWGTHPTSADIEQQPWFPLFADTFARWSELAGVRYVYEPNDDRAGFPSSRGVAGTRPDIRIGGHRIDGNANTLAYNYFPNTGDMVIDTDDSFLESKSQNSINLRNTVAHEHGHGLGLEHVCPVNRTKLMEPNLTSTFDGPQFDDIYSANRLYGDHLEDVDGDAAVDDNDGSARATDLGLLALGTNTYANLSIDDNSDRDYFKYELPGPDVTYTVTVTPQGPTYNEGAQNSDNSCSAGSSFASASVHDLAIQLRRANRSTVFMSIDQNGTGQPESAADVTPPDGAGPYWMRVTPESSSNSAQLYTLAFEVTGPPPPKATVAAQTVDESAGAATFTVTLDEPSTFEGSVDYATAAGTADTTTDFTPTSGTLTFAPGETEKTVEVAVVDDLLDEDDENFDLLLSNPLNLEILTSSASASILDNDELPTLDVIFSATESAEDGPPVQVIFSLSAPSGRTLSFEIANTAGSASPGSDFTSPGGTAIFEPGRTSAPLDITFLADDLPEQDETVAFALTDPVNVILPEAPQMLTIFDDDAPRLLAETATATLTSDGSAITLTWSAARGRPYNIEVSDDLLLWRPHPTTPQFTPDSTFPSLLLPTSPDRFFRITDPAPVSP